MKCEYCKEEHDGSFGSGRFCSLSCGQKYSNSFRKKGTPETKAKYADLLSRVRHLSSTIKATEKRKEIALERKRNKPESYKAQETIKRALFEVRGNKCESCGIIEWQSKPLALEIHHIDGNSKNNDLSNLQLLCPNCHSQTDNFRFKKGKAVVKVTDEALLAAILDDKNKSIKAVLRSVDMADKGTNFKRVYTLCIRYKIDKFSL